VIETFIIVVPLMLSPGPANVVSFLLGTRYKVTQLLPFLLGILFVYTVVAIGLGSLGRRIADFSPIALGALQAAGGLIIIYLGIQLVQRTKREAKERYPTFLNGITLQCLNPKFPGVVLAVFANRHPQSTLITASIICVVGAVGLLTYSIAGSLLRDRHESGRRFEVVDLVSGVLLCVVGLWFILQAFLNT
jgi:threonine/homoserine/homoserine lactone efflux protein